MGSTVTTAGWDLCGEICMFMCQRLSISFFRLNGNSKLAIGVNISVNGGLSLC